MLHRRPGRHRGPGPGRGGKVILVGDHRQLPEIGPGGGFAATVDRLGGYATRLRLNRRQNVEWEIAALDQLREGDVGAAWAAYKTNRRVTLAPGAVELHETAVTDWAAAHRAGRSALLLAGTRTEAAALNTLARHHAGRAGLLSGRTLTIGGREFRVGDRVLATRNHRHQTTPDGQPAAVENGTLGTVTRVGRRRGYVDVATVDGRHLRLDRDYLTAGHLDHGYAMTIHKSQGATCDDAFVVGPAGLYREAAYVALSRARHGARIYATTRDADLLERAHVSGHPAAVGATRRRPRTRPPRPAGQVGGQDPRHHPGPRRPRRLTARRAAPGPPHQPGG